MKSIIWSPSRLKKAEHCLADYYYSYIDKDKSNIPTTAYMSMGNLFHSLMEQFYKDDGSPYFKSKESFAGAAVGQWFRLYVEPGKNRQGKEIKWDFKGQPFVLKRDIGDIAEVIYEKYSNPNQPRPVKQEHRIKASLDGMQIQGIMDAILPFTEEERLVIVDYKSDRFPPGRNRLRYDPQFGLYPLLVGIELNKNPLFRRQLNFPEEEAEKLGGNPILLSSMVKMQFDHLRTGETVQVERTEKDLEKILVSIKDREEQIGDNNFIRSPGNHCVTCLRKKRCDKDTAEGIELKLPEANQIELFPLAEKQKKSRKRPQKTLRFPKEIDQPQDNKM